MVAARRCSRGAAKWTKHVGPRCLFYCAERPRVWCEVETSQLIQWGYEDPLKHSGRGGFLRPLQGILWDLFRWRAPGSTMTVGALHKSCLCRFGLTAMHHVGVAPQLRIILGWSWEDASVHWRIVLHCRGPSRGVRRFCTSSAALCCGKPSRQYFWNTK